MKKRQPKKEEPVVSARLNVQLHEGGTLAFIKTDSTHPSVRDKVEVVFKWGRISFSGAFDDIDGDRISSFLKKNNDGR